MNVQMTDLRESLQLKVPPSPAAATDADRRGRPSPPPSIRCSVGRADAAVHATRNRRIEGRPRAAPRSNGRCVCALVDGDQLPSPRKKLPPSAHRPARRQRHASAPRNGPDSDRPQPCRPSCTHTRRTPTGAIALALAAAQLDAQADTQRRESAGHALAPTLGWVYLTDHYAAHTESLLAELRRRWPGVAWVGATGVGISASGVEYFDEGALVLMLAAIPAAHFRVFSGTRPLGDFAAHTALVHADPATADLPRADPRDGPAHDERLPVRRARVGACGVPSHSPTRC